MVFQCNKCEFYYVTSKEARMEICYGCDIGLICYKCRDEPENPPERVNEMKYCRDCEIVRKEKKRFNAVRAKAEIMLSDWMKSNPMWEEKEKIRYLELKAVEAENKWNRYGKVEFIQSKLKTFMKKAEPSKE